MFRLTQSASQWVLAMSMACLLLAWPLHRAEHAREALAGLGVAAADGSVDALDGAGGHGGEAQAEPCAWSLFHAGHLPLGGSPAALRWHAEASAPPALPPEGPARGQSPLTAHPRGPPAA